LGPKPEADGRGKKLCHEFMAHVWNLFFLSSVMVSVLSFQIVVVDPTLYGTSAPQEDTIIRGKIRRPYEKHTAWIGFPFLLSSTLSTRISGARLEHSLN
jgi:hypothetical protein